MRAKAGGGGQQGCVKTDIRTLATNPHFAESVRRALGARLAGSLTQGGRPGAVFIGPEWIRRFSTTGICFSEPGGPIAVAVGPATPDVRQLLLNAGVRGYATSASKPATRKAVRGVLEGRIAFPRADLEKFVYTHTHTHTHTHTAPSG